MFYVVLLFCFKPSQIQEFWRKLIKHFLIDYKILDCKNNPIWSILYYFFIFIIIDIFISLVKLMLMQYMKNDYN